MAKKVAHTVLSDHKRIGKKFIPPIIDKLGSTFKETSWVKLSIPELIWVALLNYRCGYKEGADLSLSLAKAAKEATGKIEWYAPLSSFSALTNKQKNKIVEILYQRLDYVTFLLGFAKSPRIARQMVSHGHITVNGRKMTISSYHVKVHDIVAVRPESKNSKLFEDTAERLKQYNPPEWLRLSADELKGECVAKSNEGNAQFPFDIALVGEFYSR